MNAVDLRTALAARVSPSGMRWLQEASEILRGNPGRIDRLFPAAGRQLGRIPLAATVAAGDLHAWTVDDAGRVVLLLALGDAAGEFLEPLYRHGDSAERRAVLRGLAVLPVPTHIGEPIAADALRTNDPRLVAAALVPYAAEHFPTDAVHQAVLKCLFLGVPIGLLPEIRRRATPELTRMLDDYVLERVAAGRDVPADVWPLIAVAGGTALPRRLATELVSATPDRVAAARRAHAALRTATAPQP